MRHLPECLKRCIHRVKRFAMRAGIVTIALLFMFIVMANTGEVVPLGMAVSRIAEAMGYALADTLAEV